MSHPTVRTLAISALFSCLWIAATAAQTESKQTVKKQTIVKSVVQGDVARELHFYDLRDFWTWHIGERVLEEVTPEERRKAIDGATAAFRRLANDFIQPPLLEGEEIKVLGHGNIVALGRPEQLAWIEGCLLRQRQQGPYFLDIQARVFLVEPKTFAKLELGNRAKITPDAKTHQAYVTKLGAMPGVQVVHAPRMLVRAMQDASISVGNKIAYVKDYKIEIVHPGDRKIADPVIDTIFDGVKFKGRGALVADGLVGLSCHLEVTSVNHPIPTHTVDLGGQKVTVSLPGLGRYEMETKAAVPEGGGAIFPGPRAKNRNVVFALRVSVVKS